VKYLILAARLLIGGLFIYASIYKILDPASFAVSIRNYTILPEAWSNVAAMTLPWIEFIAGVLLVAGVQTRPSAFLTTCLLAIFFGAVVYAFSIGLDIDCGCFSSAVSSKGKVGLYDIVRDAALFLVSLLIVVKDSGDLSLARVVCRQ